MPTPDLFTQADSAAQFVLSQTSLRPKIGLILGSGLGAFADTLANPTRVPYAQIPAFPRSTAIGHAGQMVIGNVGTIPVAAMQGRVHLYEGYSAQEVAFPIRVFGRMGVRAVILTNAAGGINLKYQQGALVLIRDHINLQGDNPLVGPNDDRLGPRFPDMSEPYDPQLRALARAVALQQATTLREGVYVAVPGPNLETRAEYRMLRALGADVVGMSTVPEVIVAVHQGMRVLGISIITDQCLPDALAPADIGRIIATAGEAEPRLTQLLATVVERLA
jgi:purine-nucleoside phosphorylase